MKLFYSTQTILEKQPGQGNKLSKMQLKFGRFNLHPDRKGQPVKIETCINLLSLFLHPHEPDFSQPLCNNNIMNIKKILIIGSPGAGKSTLARKLHKKLGLPLVYLDQIWHKPDFTNISREEFDQKLEEELEKPEWIIDGNYSRTLPMRLAKADFVILLDYPAEVCLQGIRNRLGKPREDMPWPIQTELDPDFVQYVQTFGSRKEQLIHILHQNISSDRLLILHSRSEADEWLQNLKS